jgi:hypothetical protein
VEPVAVSARMHAAVAKNNRPITLLLLTRQGYKTHPRAVYRKEGL